MNEKTLTKKELDFCHWFARLQNPKEAALKAGYEVLPEYRAMSLMSKKYIRNKINELEKENRADSALISAGLRRLAFGSIADAVKLITSFNSNDSPNVDALDLFNVSEIKYTNGKGIEIKFFDRLKALEQLSKVSECAENSATLSFYEAIERSTNGYGDNNG